MTPATTKTAIPVASATDNSGAVGVKKDDEDYRHVPIDDSVLNSEFVRTKANPPLRVCCFGSSAQLTPIAYLQSARNLGYVLAKRGHTCVNGAGSCGCMAAMNDGACRGNGHIVGVIHEMWLVDSPPVGTTAQQQQQADAEDKTKRDGTFHEALTQVVKPINNNTEQSFGGPHTALSPPTSSDRANAGSSAPRRELLVACGKDLQERKRLLVDKADALVVLPGGPGTFDELWEMACARNIGLSSLPIVCVNVDGFYNSFYEMLVRAYEDKLTKLKPHDIIHFEDTAEDAIRWVESIQDKREMKIKLAKRDNATDATTTATTTNTPMLLRKTSVLNPPAVFGFGWGDKIRRSLSRSLSQISNAVIAAGGGATNKLDRKDSWFSDGEDEQSQEHSLINVNNGWVFFTAGLTVGVLLTMAMATGTVRSRWAQP